MNVRSVEVRSDGPLADWHKKHWLHGLLLPGDFLEQIKSVKRETFPCHRFTTRYLTLRERVRRKNLRVREACQFSTDMDYVPPGFRSQRLRVIQSSRDVRCGNCNGHGQLRCDVEMTCPSCRGSGRVQEPCGFCWSSGKESDGTRCSHCSNGTRTVDCDRCRGLWGSNGKVTCDRCRGTGYLRCDRCDGLGILVEAAIVTKNFSHSVATEFQIEGLQSNHFKNGLTGRHFKSIKGAPEFQRFTEPEGPYTIRQQLTGHLFTVDSCIYNYNDRLFFINRITSKTDSRVVACRLPWSKLRIGVAGLCVGLLATAFLVGLANLA